MFWTAVLALFWFAVAYLTVGLFGWMGAAIVALVVIALGILVTWLA